jgi:hypothetical protein
MSGKTFVKDGFVYAECIIRGGIKICHPTGFYKFPVYDGKTKTDSQDENQSVDEES